jgi:hypothetical protein
VKRDKLDKKSEPGVFIGYSSPSKAYRIFQPQNGRILVSRDVNFMEDKQWKWEQPEEKLESSTEKQESPILEIINDNIDDEPVRGTRSLAEIYESSNIAICEPAEFEEVVKKSEWIEAMHEELRMIEKNDTWVLMDKPLHKKAIGVKWVYRTKQNSDGSINKYKARLVVKGYAQVFGVDFSKMFAQVARLDTIILLLAVAAQKNWKVYQVDVKSAFLNGYLQEEIYIEQPRGFEVKG